MVKLIAPLCARWPKGGFVDSLRLLVKGGTGGNGYPKYGGIGGVGGSVYIEAQEDYELKHVLRAHPNKRVTAGHGDNSKSYQILGKPGKDVVVKSPVGVTVITDSKKVLGELNAAGNKVLVAAGGAGGAQASNFLGQKSISRSVTLDLKLIADIGFVGFPNAGKSTLLKALSRAAPKIANYPFTTIAPNIGTMEFDDYRQITLADLPGLIEGAHRNYGLGHKFLKHVVRTNLLMFVVDVHGFQLNPHSPHRSAFETIMLLNKELELYQEDLVDKPAVLVLTKMDLNNSESRLTECMDQLKNASELCHSMPTEMVPATFINFDDVFPICARQAVNIETLKEHLRKQIDLNHELKARSHNTTFVGSREGETDKVTLI